MNEQRTATSDQRLATSDQGGRAETGPSRQSPVASRQSLSPDAARLRDYLAMFAAIPAAAKTDAAIAAALGLPARTIVDLADELLTAGILVVARCSSPPGRWLLCDDDPDNDHWQQAAEYAEQLDARAVGIHARAKHARHAINQMQARRQVETGGQRRLF